MASLDIGAYKDFILKLKIKAADGTSQIRRVRLPRVAQNGNISYEELVGLVITFHFPTADAPENFICSLTYFDEDEDTITIASTDELVDAIEQFADKKVLRITTEVKRKGAPGPAVPLIAASVASDVDRSSFAASDNSAPPQIQNVLESFVGVLASAVNSLEHGLAPPQASGSVSSPVPSAPVEEPKPPAFVHTSPPCEQVTKEAPVCVNPPCSESRYKKQEEHVDVSPVMPIHTRDSPPCSQFKKKYAVPVNFPPAVHHRHTCDSCLKTPITGNRYHALNQKDYDLCEKCFKSYSGKETHFQEHPSGKTIERLYQAPKPEAKPAPEPATELVAPPSVPTSQPKKEPLPFIHGRHTCDCCLGTPIVGKRYHAKNIKDYDICEKCYQNSSGNELQFEIVELQRDRAFQKRWNRRRQRIENMRGRANSVPLKLPVQAAAPSTPNETNEILPSSTVSRTIPIQTSAPPATTSAPPASEDFDGALKEAIRRSLEDVEPKQATEELINTAENVLTTEKEDIHADTVEDNNETPSNEIPTDDSLVLQESPHSVALEEAFDEAKLFDAMETMSVDSEKMAEEEDLDSKPAAVNLESSGASVSPKSEKDDSFAMDAVGNGDVAAEIGEALDTIAGVISEMLVEADSHGKNNSSAEAAVSETQDEENEASGALILDSENNEEAEDEWQVVEENVAKDNEIAHATQMLGSALFNSDMKTNDNENVSTLTSSDCFSAATSIPSIVPSIHLGTDVSYVASAQRQRWASQLEKLHELGFDDESLCVETLERLHAANIGCDEQDEISVTQVVNAILEQK